MSVKTYITLMAITTIVAWIGWIVVINNIDPETATFWGFAFFYLSLFLSLVGTFSILGFIFRHFLVGNKRGSAYKVSIAFRQAVLWSLAVILALGLQAQRLLAWWLLLLLIIVFVLIEASFISINRQKKRADG